MKKKITVLTGLLMAVAITAYSVSGTYAKYTSEFTGTSKATVAKWAFDVNGQTDATKEVTFDLFKNIKDSDGTSEELDVAPTKIAPGTAGKFSIALANNSEVNAEVTVSGTVTTKTASGNPVTYTIKSKDAQGNITESAPITAEIPLEFRYDGGNWGDLATVLGEVGTIKLNMNANNTPEIEWRWAFDVNDDRDTALGLAAAEGNLEAIVDLTITATQVD